jgi:Tol biopolymer transport system component
MGENKDEVGIIVPLNSRLTTHGIHKIEFIMIQYDGKIGGGIILFKISLFLITVFLTSISFCVPAYCFEGALLPPVQEELTSYNDEILQFTLRHPPSWKPVSQDHQNRHFLVFFSPIEGNDDQLQDNLSCSVENLDQPVTPDAYLKKSLDAFQNQITQLVIGNTFEVSIANQKAISVPFTGIYQNQQLAWVLAVLIKENKAYSFLLTSEPQKIENYWKQVSQIISSVRFQEKTSIPIFLAPSTLPEQPKKSLQMPTFSELQEKIPVEKPPINPPSGKILYASEDQQGNFSIYSMNPDGSGRTRLTGEPHTLAWQPSWSPDGKKILFTSFVDFHLEIYLMNADGSGQVMLTGDTEEKNYPSWSPDIKHIVFSSKPMSSSSSDFDPFTVASSTQDSEIYIMNADGSDRINISNDPKQDIEPNWSPDGSKIAFATDRDGNYEIYVMNADGSDPVRLTENFSEDYRPMWSPDGTKIAFYSNRDGNFEIYVMSADGKQAMNLTKNGFPDTDPAWSPDGNYIVFVSKRDRNDEIYRMKADGTEVVRLTKNPKDDWNPCWQPKGN